MGCKSRGDTITAICTPPGVSAIGIIRVSGDDAIDIVSTLFRSRTGQNIFKKKWGMYSGDIVGENNEVIDDVLLLVMKSPHSYTGEDVVEIHAHGNMLILRTIVELLLKRGARVAEPGEFTKRAFLNRKLDLVQAEAVLDQILAKTKKSLELSRSILEGRLSNKIYEYSNRLKTILAYVEVVIDFPEEEIPPDLWTQSIKSLEQVAQEMERLLATAECGKIIREGVILTIAGKPNVGKSSLFNALLRDNRAIVSPYPGTTRDHLEEYLSLKGVPVRLFDTAGLRESIEPVEKEGVERAWTAIFNSYLVLFVIDSTNINDDDLQLFISIKDKAEKPILLVVNKIDLNSQPKFSQKLLENVKAVVHTSAITGFGLDELEDVLLKLLLGEQGISEDIILSHEHQKNSLLRAKNCIIRILEKRELSAELVAFELREAVQSLGEITGETTSEELLDV
ncbi:MAG TPA: tRNA uridine-5-carboxymethylaminomethyl(34) synthesis GTPase MnmE, partial [Candidatus Hydrogenedens sp.]|nr:tRNA uridine-5-carboxymethylaminomethyl(34) synthesis GTPase MnmE [Candidatus Hydrogenedens sp.]